MVLWRDEESTDRWWCDLRADLERPGSDLAGLFFDVAFRQRDPRQGAARLPGFPNATEFAWALAQSYTTTDWPCEREDRTFWVAAFRSVGFLVDSRIDGSALPAEPLTLYRAGGQHDLQNPPGLSWSTSRAVAEHFARYNDEHGHRSYVFTATVPPEHLLARFTQAVAPDGATGVPQGDQWLADVDSDQLG